jgi:hypothetical protein
LHGQQQDLARRREERAFREKQKRSAAGESELEKEKEQTPGERTTGLDHGPRGASDEDGGWRIPAGLQRVRSDTQSGGGLLGLLSTATVPTWARWRR